LGGGVMANLSWEIKGREFTNCNCSYGCPCQFNGLPTHGNCQAVVGLQIDRGHHGDVKLDGLRASAIFRWPGPIHHGKGEALAVVDERANDAQRNAMLRILTGQDTEPGATIFQVFSTTLEKLHPPVFAAIDFEVDVDARRARHHVAKLIESRGEPILNPVTKAEHRVRIDMPNGFEYSLAEIGRGWSKTTGPIALTLEDSYGQFAALHLCQNGIVKAA
jgi:hypothetical protein